MSDPQLPPQRPYTNGRVGMISGLVDILRSLNLQNVLTFGIIVAILIPSYLLWQFVHDDELRKEILSYAILIDAKVPCAVYRTSLQGQPERYNVINTYGYRGPFQLGVVVNAGAMSQNEIVDACKIAQASVEVLRLAPPTPP